MKDATCPLCTETGGALVFQADKFRVIRADEVGFAAFYRVVWTQHVAEFSDLNASERALCMAVVCAVEQTLRDHLHPTKINLAALGNVVAHLHWHVIARFDWDAHFPATVWSEPRRNGDERALALIRGQLGAVEQAIQSSLISMGLTL